MSCRPAAPPHRQEGRLCRGSLPKCPEPRVPAHFATGWPEPDLGPQGTEAVSSGTSTGTALAGECFHPGADTHLFLPFVTHASATWRRSETLRDRPSPVVPFTVPNKDSVSGTNQHILPARRQRCGAGSETPASEDVTGRNVRGWVQGGRMTCSHLRLRLSLV